MAKKKTKKKQRAKKQRRHGLIADSARALEIQPAANRSRGALLERSRTQWQFGDWDALLSLDPDEVSRDKDRAKLALLVAAAQSHAGMMDAAHESMRLALGWGANRELAARVLISATTNSLGRVAAALEDDSATRHFETAIALVEPRADCRLLARSRRVRETARLGLLPEASALMDIDLKAISKAPEDHAATLKILKSEIDLLRHEFSISLRRGQLHRTVAPVSDGEVVEADEDFQSLAVSQLGQDLWVLERTNFQRGGFFVEFGATDGLTLSNTWLLEAKFGWTGLLAEPNPAFHDDLRANRTGCSVTDAVIGARTGEDVEFIFADVYGGISDYAEADNHADKREAYRAQGHVQVLTTVSLDDFLKKNGAPRVIDYLSIDTEGSEFDILNAFPFDDWTIRLITVEHNFTPQRENIRALLEEHGYRRTQARWDDWYELVR